MNDEEMKQSVKMTLSLKGDYSTEEILEALIMNDSVKIAEMRLRCAQLRSSYDKFVSDIEGADKQKRDLAIRTFKRPAK